jgi:hypothetical protein
VADDGDWAVGTASGTIVPTGERPAENRRDAERPEVVPAGEDAVDGLLLAAFRQVELHRRPGQATVENRCVRLERLPHRETPPGCNDDEAIRLGDGQRPQ